MSKTGRRQAGAATAFVFGTLVFASSSPFIAFAAEVASHAHVRISIDPRRRADLGDRTDTDSVAHLVRAFRPGRRRPWLTRHEA
jgi:hypothetical protein